MFSPPIELRHRGARVGLTRTFDAGANEVNVDAGIICIPWMKIDHLYNLTTLGIFRAVVPYVCMWGRRRGINTMK